MNASPSPSPAPYPSGSWPHGSPARQPVYAPPARRPRKRSNRVWLFLGLGLLAAFVLLLPLAAALGVYGYYQVSQRIVPGVFVGSSRLNGMTVTEAAIEIQKSWNMERQIVVEDGLHTKIVAPAALGISVDALETARQAYRVGHDQGFLAEVDQMIYSYRNGWGVAPVVRLDRAAAQAGLETLAAEYTVPARDASLKLEGSRLVAVPGEFGYTLNVDEALAALEADPLGILLNGQVRLSLKPILPRIEDVSQAIEAGQRLIDTPISLRAYDPVTNEWLDLSIPPEKRAAWLRIETGENGPQVGLDQLAVAETLAGLSRLGDGRWFEATAYTQAVIDAVHQGTPVEVLLKHSPTTYTVQPGDTLLKIGWKVGMPFWKIQQANPNLDPKNLWVGQEITIPSKDELLPLPVVKNKRVVISISDQHLWAYQDGNLVAEHVISTGIDRSPTQPGVFQIQTRELEAYASVWDLYMPHFLGIYEAWPGFMNGIHGLPTLSNGQRLWANILGRPASYGCIILDLRAAEWLYNWAEDGVVVEIRP